MKRIGSQPEALAVADGPSLEVVTSARDVFGQRRRRAQGPVMSNGGAPPAGPA